MVSKPFLNLPSRELRTYYQVIKHPQCFKGLQKLVRGIRGREKPTGVSLFKSWQAFEDEASIIWKNARLYNEDGSEIFQLATDFEVPNPLLFWEVILTLRTGNLPEALSRSEKSGPRATSAQS